jgi:hypothetical protein
VVEPGAASSYYLIRAVLRRLADEAATVAPIGFSLGGNLTLKLLGEPLGVSRDTVYADLTSQGIEYRVRR